jgi:putative ABC transport system permease protein
LKEGKKEIMAIRFAVFDSLKVLASRLRGLFTHRRVDEDFQRELDSHLVLLTEESIRRGMTPEEARRTARVRLGGFTQLRETHRDLNGLPWLETLVQDVRYGLRMLRKNPGFTSVAVLTLALGIGANTAIFSIVNAVFLRPLPFPNADRIYVVDRVGNPIGGASISFPIYIAWEKTGNVFFDHLALLAWWGDATLTGVGESERIPIAGASSGVFSVLGVQPALGRDFLPEESRPGGPKAVILSDSLWRGRFGADRNILGRPIKIDGEARAIVGVLPQGFQLPIPGMRDAELWLPIGVPLTSDNAANGALLCLGLLKENVTPPQAAAALTLPLSDLRREFPKMFSAKERARLEPLHSFLADRAGPAPLLLLGAVGLVLLLACANIANLTLARFAHRRQEIAVRAAIGAGRARVTQQLLTESVLLALLGGTLGVIACYTSFDFILTLVPANLPRVGGFQMDWKVLLFALFLSGLTGVAFGLAPAFSASQVDLGSSLKEANPRAGLGGNPRVRSMLAVSEISLSLVLLIGAALALESFALLMRVRPGFDPGNLLTFNLSLRPVDKAGVATRLPFYDRAMARLRALPDVEQVALIDALPLEQGRDVLFTIEGGSGPVEPEATLDADFRAVSPEFFETLRIPLLRGRGFFPSDDARGGQVVIINQTMARMFWLNQDPVGQRIWIGKPMGPEWTEPSPREIVGVVGDIHGESLASTPNPTMYVPYAQRPIVQAYFVVRTRQAPLATVPEVQKALHQVDADLPLAQLKTMEEVISDSVIDWRFRTILLSSFGALAVAIAAVGVYGVISYSVEQRTHEIGVRVALGARREDVFKHVVGQGLKLTLLGIAIGIVGAVALTRLLSSLLYGVRPDDPATFIVVSLILTSVALLACYVPARRATKIDPMVALRYE